VYISWYDSWCSHMVYRAILYLPRI